MMKGRTITITLFLLYAFLVACGNKGVALRGNPSEKEVANALTDIEERRDEWKKVGLPRMPKDQPQQVLERRGYIASYNKTRKTPNWVAWQLTREHVTGNAKRPGNAFHEDDEVPMPRATSGDYKGTTWSRGHMCPAGDNKWSGEAMYETFLLSYICPQDRGLNNGMWNQIELICRRWAEQYGNVYVVCGPLFYKDSHQYLGFNKIAVPDAFFKVVLHLGKRPMGIGFVTKNANVKGKKDLYVKTINEVEHYTNMTFFPLLDKVTSKKVKSHANISDW